MGVRRAIEISLEGEILRYSEDYLILEEEIEDGTLAPVIFAPYLKSVSPFKYQINMEGKTAVPSTKISIADQERVFIDFFEGREYEAASVVLYVVNEGQIEEQMVGYITGVSRDSGVVSFTMRGDESKAELNYLKYFTASTFQWTEVLIPREVNIQPSFEMNMNIPWRTFKISRQATSIANQGFKILGGGTIRDLILRPGDDFIRLSTKTNTYERYEPAEGFYIAVSEVNVGNTYRLKIDTENYAYTALSGDTANDILAALFTAFDGGGVYTSHHNTVKERLYFEADPALVDTVISTLDDQHLYFAYDPDAIGNPKTLIPVEDPLFPNPNGAGYAIAVLGNSELVGGIEVIAYSYAMKGSFYQETGVPGSAVLKYEDPDELWFLSGIPNAITNDPVGDAGASLGDPDVVDAASLYAKYGIGNRHQPYEWISPELSIDSVYVDAGGYVPLSLDDPKVSSGYLTLGKTIAFGENNKKYYKWHRFKVDEIIYNVYDDNRDTGEIKDVVLKIDLHVRPTAFSPLHTYFTNTLQGRWELPRKVNIDDPVYTAIYNGTVTALDVALPNISENAYNLLTGINGELQRAKLKDRYKGYRVDAINDITDLRQTLGSVKSDGATVSVIDQGGLNSRIVDNAAKEFAVCTGSEVLITDAVNPDVYERLYFFDKYDGDDPVERLYVEEFKEGGDPADPNDIEDRSGVLLENGKQQFYFNLMTYTPGISSSEIERTTDVNGDARLYFLSKRYRVLRDPVPENSDSLGKAFPIVYGRVNRVPLLQVISKKAMVGNAFTAGDDVYVYASHPCDVRQATDISIWMDTEKEDNEPVSVEDFDANLVYSLAKNPFPVLELDHHVLTETGSGYSTVVNQGEIITPYHETVKVKSRDEDVFYGVRLRGYEWDNRAGKLDRRYPIRNGVGTSRLFGSFGGYVATNGDLIDHPCDIFAHFVRTYGKWPFNVELINEANLAQIKSKTPKYKASVFITEEISVADFAYELFKQFAIFPFIYNGEMRLSLIDLDRVDYDKLVADNYNILEGVKEDIDIYKDIYSQIIVNYNYNYITDKYESKIDLNSSNNKYCSMASKAKGQKKTFTIDAKWIMDASTANEVARRYARLLASRRFKYVLRVRDTGVRYLPGDVIPMTFSEFGIDDEPVTVVASTLTRDYIELEVERRV